MMLRSTITDRSRWDKITGHMFCVKAAAQMAAQLILGRQKARNTGTIVVGPEFLLLDPMDLNEYVDAPLGANGQGINITEITENDDDSFTIHFEEYGDGQGDAPVYGTQPNTGYIPNYNVAPGSVNAPAIFDVPVALANAFGGLRTWIGVSGGNANWGGCNVYISSDNATFAFYQRVETPSRMGSLTSILPVGSDPDTTNTLAVDLTQSFGALSSGTSNDADQGNTLCFVDGEYVSYQQANLTSAYHYNLGKNGATAGKLRRGFYGSAIASHPIGSLFVRLDENVVEIPYEKTDVGKTIYLKFQSFNIWGSGIQDLASVTSWSHVVGGPPTLYAPSGLTATAGIKSIQLNWTNPADIGVEAVEVWRSSSSAFGAASKIGDAPPYATSYTDSNVASNTQYWYWIRIRDIAGNFSVYNPSNAGAGATTTTGQASTNDIQNAAITAAKLANLSIDSIFKFAAGITPVEIVAALPSVTTADNGRTAVLTTNGKLYRVVAGAWSPAVAAVDITGTITAGQIAAGAIDITKFAAGLTTVEILGSLPGSGNFDGRIVFLTTDKKLYRYSSTAGAFIRSTDGADIVANSITAGQIAAGAIGATQIAANAISASKMFIGSTDNIVLDPYFNDLGYWNAWAGGVTSSVIFPGGSWGTRPALIATSSGTGSYAGHYTKKISCTPGDQFYAACIGGTGGQTATVQLVIEWMDATGGFVGSTTVQARGGVIGGPYDFSGVVTAPSGAYYLDFFFYGDAPSGGNAISMSNPQLNRRASGQLIVDGAITAAKIGAGEVVAGKLASGAVTAGTVAANAITAGTVASNAITAGTLAVGAINATAIIVNNILVTGHIVGGAVSGSYGGTLGSYSVPGTGTWYQVGYITCYLETGTNVSISMYDYITWNTNGPKGYYNIKNPGGTSLGSIGFGGGSCPDFINTAYAVVDTAGYTGYQNYYFEMYWQAGNQPTSQGIVGHIVELKR
jgi:hypothetical protein